MKGENMELSEKEILERVVRIEHIKKYGAEYYIGYDINNYQILRCNAVLTPDNKIIFNDSDEVFIEWKEYDEQNQIEYYKNSDGTEAVYDKNKKIIRIQYPDGTINETTYNDDGHEIIHIISTDGFEKWYEYESKDSFAPIHYWTSEGLDEWYK